MPAVAITPPSPPADADPNPTDEPAAPAEATAVESPGEPPAAEEPTSDEPSRKREPRVHSARPSNPALSQTESRHLLEEARDFLRAQRYEEASEAFSRLARPRGKSRGPAEVGLAKIAFQQKHYEEAVNHARRGARYGGGVEARVVLGDAYFRLDKFEDARKAYTEALKLDPENRTAKQNLALIEQRGN